MDEKQIVDRVAAAIGTFQVSSNVELARVVIIAHRTALGEAGFICVPRKPNEVMLIAAREWSREKYGKPIGNDAAEGCYKAMIGIGPYGWRQVHPTTLPTESDIAAPPVVDKR